MNSQKLNEFQNEMDAMFQRKVTIIQEITRFGAIDAFSLKLTVRGLPVEVRAYGKTIEEAEDLVLSEMFTQINKASKCDLFPTQGKDRYQQVELTRNDISTIFATDEILPNELLDSYAHQTTALMTKLDNGKYECVIENEGCNIHARATCPTEELARRYAIWTARRIYEPELHEVNRDAVWKTSRS